MGANFVDRAIENARVDARIQATRYTSQPERMTDLASEAFQVRKLYARIAALEQRVNALEVLLADETAKRIKYETEHVWLVTTMNRLAAHYAHLTGEDNEPVAEPQLA